MYPSFITHVCMEVTYQIGIGCAVVMIMLGRRAGGGRILAKRVGGGGIHGRKAESE